MRILSKFMQKGTWILALNIQVCAFSARHLVVCGRVFFSCWMVYSHVHTCLQTKCGTSNNARSPEWWCQGGAGGEWAEGHRGTVLPGGLCSHSLALPFTRQDPSSSQCSLSMEEPYNLPPGGEHYGAGSSTCPMEQCLESNVLKIFYYIFWWKPKSHISEDLS